MDDDFISSAGENTKEVVAVIVSWQNKKLEQLWVAGTTFVGLQQISEGKLLKPQIKYCGIQFLF